MADRGDICAICGGQTAPVGTVHGTYSGRDFALRRCPACGFAYIADPWTDYEQIYSDAYYAGRGVDPLVDYVFELEHRDRTVRRYEWRGIEHAVGRLATVGHATRWLDYGCGTGGLVTHLRKRGCDAVGFEQGWSVPRLREAGVPLLTDGELDGERGTFDVVSAIEVIEHVLDPLAELRRMAALLKPGGVLFLTTGNAAPYRERLTQWRYVVPEIHISFFEPRTLSAALARVGLCAEEPGFGPGWTDIIRFKLLKNLGRRTVSPIEHIVPWPLVARVLDARLGLTAHPVGVRQR